MDDFMITVKDMYNFIKEISEKDDIVYEKYRKYCHDCGAEAHAYDYIVHEDTCPCMVAAKLVTRMQNQFN